MHTIYRYGYRYGRLLSLLSVALLLPIYVLGEGTDLPPPLSGTVQLTLDHDEDSGTWALHVNGSFEGSSTAVTSMQLFGTDANGMRLADTEPLDPAFIPSSSPFHETFQVPKLDPRWAETGIELTLSNGTGVLSVQSSLFPILWKKPVLIDHAVGNSLVAAPNFESGGVPDGIGIPHALLDGLPEGDYFAVVFFDQAKGCPSNYYHMNAFEPKKTWGTDERPLGPYVFSADSTSGGGCMQEFHIDPSKSGDWLWGALSTTGTSSAIADENGIPSFAICATAAACDPIAPHAAINTSPVASTSRAVSDVLFLPGIKGSELYEDNPLCLVPSDDCGIKMWLPLADVTVPELFLNAQGTSKKSVFVRNGALLGSAFGISFYDSFTSSLNDARAADTFGNGWDWKAAAYDWRLSLPDIVQNGVERGSHIYFTEAPDGASVPYLERTLRSLASSSPSGKVTIVAHSNGGLVAKALMQSLGDSASEQLIDSVIFVGVPQSGAPRAVGALLFGDAEGIPGIPHVPDLIMSTAHAREFALNSPMAYHLLPSARYMSALQPEHPVLSFDGRGIQTEAELKSFALAQDGDRSMPDASDLTVPNILNPALYGYAEDEHTLLDTWKPPSGIEVYELGGYGANTISGIDLYTTHHKDGSASRSYRPLFTTDGDGTVPIISALMMSADAHVHQIWLDLEGMHGGYSHANLLEAPDVETTINAILRGSSAFPATAHAMEIPAISAKQLGFYVHSPVSITVIDQDGLRSSVSKDGTQEGIPGSTAGTLGEVKYIVVPAEQPYTVLLAGEKEGSFTFDMQELADGVVTASSTIADVPVQPGAKAEIAIDGSLASTSALTLDENGDGSEDMSISPLVGGTVFPDSPVSTSDTASSSPVLPLSAQSTSFVRKAARTLRSLAPLSTSTLSSISANASALTQKAKAVVRDVMHKKMEELQRPPQKSASFLPADSVQAPPHTKAKLLTSLIEWARQAENMLLFWLRALLER